MDNFNLTNEQSAAVSAATSSAFHIITGPAGSGKTTLISEMIKTLRRRREEIKLCAFTGKAAEIVGSKTGEPSSTIHSMLEYDGYGFKCESLRGYCVIVDEASMVDSHLMAQIIKRKPDRLILVGDCAQLPPVGKGQPFHDLIKIKPSIVSRIKDVHRAKGQILEIATMMRNGEKVIVNDNIASDEKVYLCEESDHRCAHNEIIKAVNNGFFDFTQDVILCPKNDDANSLNYQIARIVNPRDCNRRIIEGDRIINTKNIPKKDFWNGSVGIVISINSKGMKILPDNGTDEVSLSKEESQNIQLSYALTVHKSQGSEYRRVFFLCLERDKYMLDRSLVYTAITRAKKVCAIIGNVDLFKSTSLNHKKKETVLQQLAKND